MVAVRPAAAAAIRLSRTLDSVPAINWCQIDLSLLQQNSGRINPSAFNTPNKAHSMSNSSLENDEDFGNEESGWSSCSEVSGFVNPAPESYKGGSQGATKRMRGTSIVRVSRHHSTTDEETNQSSSQEKNAGLDGSPITQSRESEDET